MTTGLRYAFNPKPVYLEKGTNFRRLSSSLAPFCGYRIKQGTQCFTQERTFSTRSHSLNRGSKLNPHFYQTYFPLVEKSTSYRAFNTSAVECKFLDPRTDLAFKKLFGREENKDLAIDFINNMADLESPIVDISFADSNLNPSQSYEKSSIVDVKCTDENGRIYIIEMQVSYQEEFPKRSLYYAARNYADQMKKGGGYENLKEVILIAVCDHNLFKSKVDFRSTYKLLDKEDYTRSIDGISLIFIELAKFNKKIDEVETSLEKWCYFLKNAQKFTNKEIEKLKPTGKILKAIEEISSYNWSEKENSAYEAYMKNKRDYNAQLASAENKGMKKGKREGVREGIEKGRMETLKMIVQRMGEAGTSYSEIARCLNITEEEVEILSNRNYE
jgi:predicted transposase/invertase (TIGR01784 family)